MTDCESNIEINSLRGLTLRLRRKVSMSRELPDTSEPGCARGLLRV